jgi:hypothetical protein
MRQPGVFGNLPAIFAGDLTENCLEVEQGVLVRFRAREVGTQTLVELLQARKPTPDGPWGWLDFLWGGMVKVLHAFLVSDGQLIETVLVLLVCHISMPGA